MENTIELPQPFVDVMITYEKTTTYGAYNMQSRKAIVTERGFYSKLFNNFSIPPEYQFFNGVLLPHGFGGTKLSIDKVIKWESIPEELYNKKS